VVTHLLVPPATPAGALKAVVVGGVKAALAWEAARLPAP
jgi:hypothetical protein